MSFVDHFFGRRDAVRTLVVAPYARDELHRDRFDEWVSLVEAADLDAVGVETAMVRDPHPGTYFRAGAIARLQESAKATGADVVAVDVDLTPTQQRELEKALDGPALLDRTAIILIIFGRRAQSRAGKLQVELAQAEYALPRLVGLWQHFDRERGARGVRSGAGEKQIEIDRRLLRNRITALKRELETVERTRDLHRGKRRRRELLHAAAVGYTNVGKSTLLRALAGGPVFVRDMPFATLDPLTRRIELADGTKFLLTDTVGFVQDLPHGLVEAFKSTLEEVLEADVLIHVVDASVADPRSQVDTTMQVLDELGALDRPMLYVLNKLDLVRDPGDVLTGLADLTPQVRATLSRGEGLEAITDWIRHHARARAWTVRIRLPVDRPELIEEAERIAGGGGKWSAETVEYEVPADSRLAAEWAD